MPNPNCKFTLYKSDAYYGVGRVLSTYAKDAEEYTRIAGEIIANGNGPVRIYEGNTFVVEIAEVA
jgi:hypothetical protein